MVPKSIPCTCTPSPEASTRSLPDLKCGGTSMQSVKPRRSHPSCMHTLAHTHPPHPQTQPNDRSHTSSSTALMPSSTKNIPRRENSCNTPERTNTPITLPSGRRGYPPTLMNGRRNVRCYLRTHRSARLIARKGPAKGGLMSDSVAGP